MSRVNPGLSWPIFNEGLRTVHQHVRLHGASDLLSEDDWGMLNEEVLDSGIIIGSQSIFRGLKNGVTHALHLRVYGEGSASNGANDKWGFLTDLRIHAAEGEFDDQVMDDHLHGYRDGMGTLVGMVVFQQDGSVDADFAHGTGPSSNPTVQQRMEEIVDVFGLPASIIGPDNADQFFYYDDEAMIDLIKNLPQIHDL